MDTITLWQPYATLVAEGLKDKETRSWAPPNRLIGQRIAIHAAKRKTDRSDVSNEIFAAMCEIVGSHWEMGMPYGAVVATAKLADAVQIEDNDGETVVGCYATTGCLTDEIPIDPYGDFSVGRWLWLLDDIIKLDPPIPATGRQGIWKWHPDDASVVA